MYSPNYLALDWITYGKCIQYYLFSFMPFSLFHMKITASVAKSLYQVQGRCYLHFPIFFLYMHSLFFWKIKICSDRCFHQQIRLQTTVQWYIVRDYSSAKIVFNIINKCHTLPIIISYCCFCKKMTEYSDIFVGKLSHTEFNR